jgi:hypothetical protein
MFGILKRERESSSESLSYSPNAFISYIPTAVYNKNSKNHFLNFVVFEFSKRERERERERERS